MRWYRLMQIGWYSFFNFGFRDDFVWHFDTHNHHLLCCEIFEIGNVDNMVHVYPKEVASLSWATEMLKSFFDVIIVIHAF